MNEDEKTTASVSIGAITADGLVVGEREEVGVWGEFRFWMYAMRMDLE